MSMEVISTALGLMSILVSLIYGWMLLSFIQATQSVWAIWIISMIVGSFSIVLSFVARDEFYAAEFERSIDKAIENINKRHGT